MPNYPPNTAQQYDSDGIVHIGSVMFGGTWCSDEVDPEPDLMGHTSDEVSCTICLRLLAEHAAGHPVSDKRLRKVWAVSSGSYSSYSVSCLFERKADAKAYAGTWGDVEEFWLYAPKERPQRVKEFVAQVNLWDDGKMGNRGDRKPGDGVEHFDHSFLEHTRVEFATEVPEGRPKTRFVRAPVHRGNGGRLEVRGRDGVAVTKVLSDAIAEWIVKTGSMAQIPEVVWREVDW